MKKFTLLFSLFCLSMAVIGQTNCERPTAIHWSESNNISAPIVNAGNPFYNPILSNNGVFTSTVNNAQAASSIYITGLWMGGIDPGGNLKITTSSFGGGSYLAGPVETLPDTTVCINWDKIWVVTRNQIETHLADLNDNGSIDNPITEIFSWPAIGNANFEDIEGFPLPDADPTLAPFFDSDNNSVYNPEAGDFPLPNNISSSSVPNEITYCLFNDNHFLGTPGIGDPLKMQVGQTTYTYDCEADNPLNNTIFVNYQMTNKALEDVDSLHIGMFADFDLGCHFDDYVGCSIPQNSFFAYNEDNVDGIGGSVCDGTPTFGENPPAQFITILNQPLSNFTYYFNSGQGQPPGTEDPQTPIEYFRYLTGSWKDGSPLEFGGDGYQEGTGATAHAYPDDPNNPDGWSMTSEDLDGLDRRAIGSSKIGKLVPGQSFSWDLAFTFVREDDLSHLENVTAMYDHIDQVQAAYDNQFADNCMPTATQNIAATDYQFKIFPNPTSGVLNIQFPDLNIQTIRLIDVTGKVVLEKQEQFQFETSLDLSAFSKGIYFLQMENGAQRFYEKISVQ